MSFWDTEIPKRKAFLILAACAVVPIMFMQASQDKRSIQQVSPSSRPTQSAQAPQQSRPFDCSTITPERREAYLELKRRLAQGGLTNSEYYAVKEAVWNFETELSAC